VAAADWRHAEQHGVAEDRPAVGAGRDGCAPLSVRLVLATFDRLEEWERDDSTDGSPFPKTVSTDATVVGRVVQLDNDGFAIEFL
jgi:hypothetical protein